MAIDIQRAHGENSSQAATRRITGDGRNEASAWRWVDEATGLVEADEHILHSLWVANGADLGLSIYFIYFNWISRKGTWDILSLVFFFLSRCRFTDAFRASVTNLHQSHVAGLSSRRAILWKVFVLVQHSMLPDLIRSFGGAWLLLFAIDYSNYAIHETTWNIQKPFMRLCHSARVFWSLRLMLNNRLRCRIH